MARVTFQPFGRSAEIADGATLLDLARELGIPLAATCGGKKVCGKCQVVLDSGGDGQGPSERERELLGPALKQGRRLACEVVPAGDMTITVPPEAMVGRQVILTSETEHRYPVRLSPVVELLPARVPALGPGQSTASRERLLSALAAGYGLKNLAADPAALRALPGLLGPAPAELAAVVWGRRRLLDLRPGRSRDLLGMAFDIGSTTVVGYLLDLASGQKLAVSSAMNPQISHGDDVISRISFCQDNQGGLERLGRAIVECLNRIIADCAARAGVDQGSICEVTVVGNTAMHHIFAGLNPSQLARAPYAPVVAKALDLPARELGLAVLPGANVHLLPLVAGFVGADTVACVLATGMHRSPLPTLLVDLGTNGEIVFGSRKAMVTCSTAAGPAFEGGRLGAGMRAAAGAIDRVEIDPGDLAVRCRTIDGAPALGICGSGVISALAAMIRAGVLTATGSFAEGLDSPRLRQGPDGPELVLAWAAETGTGRDLVLSKKDVAEVQLAKAAVHAGCLMAMEALGGRPRRVLLAGACGNYIDPADALTVGLLPDPAKAPVIAVGNAAGHGACLALLDRRLRAQAGRIARRARYLELAGSARFQDLFVEGMIFESAA